jgi:hypothetical protein
MEEAGKETVDYIAYELLVVIVTRVKLFGCNFTEGGNSKPKHTHTHTHTHSRFATVSLAWCTCSNRGGRKDIADCIYSSEKTGSFLYV